MKKQRLLKGAAFLDELPRNKFLFSSVVEEYDYENDCGTVCCFMGWTPVIFPHLMEWWIGIDSIYHTVKFKDDDDVRHIWHKAADDLFSISEHDAYILFTPYNDDTWNQSKKDRLKELGLKKLGNNATPKAVAKNIRKYVEVMG